MAIKKDKNTKGALELWTLTGIDKADGWRSLHAWSCGDLGLLKAVGQTAKEIPTLAAQAQPQIHLSLSLHRPTSRPKPLLSRELE